MPSGAAHTARLGHKLRYLGAELWQLLVSTVVLQATLGALLVVVVGAAVAAHVQGHGFDMGAYEAWKASPGARWAPASEIVQADTAHQLLGSRLVRVLLGITGLLCVVRLTNLWVPAWSLPPRLGVTRHRIVLADDADLASVLDEAHAQGLNVAASLPSGACLRRVVLRSRGAAWWVPGLAHVGALLLLAASLVQWRYGWATGPHDISLGDTYPLVASGPLTATLEEIVLTEPVPGKPEVLRSRIMLEMPGRAARTVTISPGGPATYEGVTIYQVGHGRSLRVQAERVDGEVLDVRRVVGDTAPSRSARVRFEAGQQEQLVLVPSAEILLRLVYYNSLPARGLERPVVHVQVQSASGGHTLAEDFVTDDTVLTVGGIRLALGFEHHITVRAEREPGLAVAAAGGLLLMAGLVGYALHPARPAWLLVTTIEDGLRVDLVAMCRDVTAPWLTRLLSLYNEGA